MSILKKWPKKFTVKLGKIPHCYEQEQNTEEKKHIVTDALVSPRINGGHLWGGDSWRLPVLYEWDKPCNKNISISCFENVHSGGLSYHEFFRQEPQNKFEKSNILLECE